MTISEVKSYMGCLIYPDGRVLGKHGATRKLTLCADGRYYFTAHHEGHVYNVPVHKAVAELYVPNPNGYKYVIHKDGDKKNNDYSNLEWVDETNRLIEHKTARRVYKCSDSGEIIKEYLSISAAAKDNGVPLITVSNWLHKKAKDKRGFVWEFAK